jgi:curved DNA-binding protein CbpA
MNNNYYQTLQVFPGSSYDEIKKAYRRLVVQFHPDKNPEGAQRFLDIQAAYEVLSDPELRKNYDLRNGFNIRREEPILNPQKIVRQAEDLRNYVLTLNIHTLDYDALRYHILKILSEYNIELLEDYPEYRNKVVHFLMSISRYLSYNNSLEIFEKLKKLAGDDPELRLTVGKFHLNQRRKYRRQQFFPLWVLLLTLALLVMLHLLS